jgi:DNA-binding NarL/FixJ family response regulator
VAVCATELVLERRIKHALTLAGHEVVATTAGLPELIEKLPLLEADLAVVVVRPVHDAAHLSLLRRRMPGLHLVAVVPGQYAEQSGRLLAADLDGLLLADQIEQVLAPAIAAAGADQLCVPSGALPALAAPVFSHREKQVLKLLLAGLTNSEIASRLYLSESTVKSHLSSSFRKLGVSSRAEVMRRAQSGDADLRQALQVERNGDGLRPVMA